MTIDIEVLLKLANLLLIPGFGYVIVLERRLMRLETLLAAKLDSLPCLVRGACHIKEE